MAETGGNDGWRADTLSFVESRDIPAKHSKMDGEPHNHSNAKRRKTIDESVMSDPNSFLGENISEMLPTFLRKFGETCISITERDVCKTEALTEQVRETAKTIMMTNKRQDVALYLIAQKLVMVAEETGSSLEAIKRELKTEIEAELAPHDDALLGERVDGFLSSIFGQRGEPPK